MSLASFVTVAEQGWRIEEPLQAAKGLTGIVEHQIRSWTSGTGAAPVDPPAILVHAFVTVATATERRRTRAPTGLIKLALAESRPLLKAHMLPAHRTLDRLLAWSTWRRGHQATARDCRYRRREQP